MAYKKKKKKNRQMPFHLNLIQLKTFLFFGRKEKTK